MAAHRRRRLLCAVNRASPNRQRMTACAVIVVCALLGGVGGAQDAASPPVTAGDDDGTAKPRSDAGVGLDERGLEAARRQAVAAPSVVSEVTEQAVGERRDRVRARYQNWLSRREPASHLREVPEMPAAAEFPPLPDAPDGEITHELDGDTP